MEVLINNMGCDDTTYTIMNLEENELQFLIKFANENNKNSKYGCQPTIAIYKNFTINRDKDDENYIMYDYNSKDNLMEE